MSLKNSKLFCFKLYTEKTKEIQSKKDNYSTFKHTHLTKIHVWATLRGLVLSVTGPWIWVLIALIFIFYLTFVKTFGTRPSSMMPQYSNMS